MHTSTSHLDGSATASPTPVRNRVFIVDDHPIFRQGLTKLILSEPDLDVCGEASSATQAISALREIQADIAVVDISLPGTNGIELIKHLRAEHPRLPILIISAHDEQVYALRALRAGAAGYLMKRESDTILIPAIRRVLSGKVWVSPAFGEQLIYRVAHSQKGDSPLDALSDREMEILRLIGEGKSSHQIAQALNLSIKTIESHRLHVKEKLNLPTSADLVRFAAEWVGQETC